MQLKLKNFFFLILIFLFFSCKKNSLKDNLAIECDYSSTETTKTVTDINNYFNIDIPKKWKREFYVDTSASRLYCADTTRELNETFIIDLGSYSGHLEVNSEFLNKTKEIILENNPETKFLTSKIINFKNHRGILLQGSSKSEVLNLKKHFLESYVVLHPNAYLKIKVDLYGNNLINDRICEALYFIDNLEILNP